jgi:hypothetical protein
LGFRIVTGLRVVICDDFEQQQQLKWFEVVEARKQARHAAGVCTGLAPPKFPAMRQKFADRLNTKQCTEMVAPGITGRTRPTKVKKQAAQGKRKRDDVDVEKLEQAVTELVRYMERLCLALQRRI